MFKLTQSGRPRRVKRRWVSDHGGKAVRSTSTGEKIVGSTSGEAFIGDGISKENVRLGSTGAAYARKDVDGIDPRGWVRMPARANSGEAQIDRGKASRIADSALLHVEGATSDLGQLGVTFEPTNGRKPMWRQGRQKQGSKR